MNYQTIEQELAELPLYIYAWVDPQTLEFSDRVRHICQTAKAGPARLGWGRWRNAEPSA